MSRPVRALWIEICPIARLSIVLLSRPVRALWIEMGLLVDIIIIRRSRPVRALWIEIRVVLSAYSKMRVEAREGLVD